MHRGTLTAQGILIRGKRESSCFGLLGADKDVLIPYFNVLSGVPAGTGTRVAFVQPEKPHTVDSIVLEFNRSEQPDQTDALMDENHGSSVFGTHPILRHKLFIIINPHGGPGKADHIFRRFCKPVFDAAGVSMEIVYTTHSKHATTIAREADLASYDAIVCVSGDGIPHEVINAIMKRPDAAQILQRVPICQLPGGSGNALSNSVTGGDNFGICSLNVIKGIAFAVDLMYITQGSDHLWSFLSQSYGIIADCDLGTEDWRWMGGARFTVGVVLKTLAMNRYPGKVAYKRVPQAELDSSVHDDKVNPEFTPKYGTVNDPLPQEWSLETHPDLSMFYVGKMPYMSADALVFPYSRASDGAMDMILWDTDLGRIPSLMLLDSMSSGQHTNNRAVRYEKISAYRLMPEIEAFVSVDGEFFPCKPFQVEIAPKACLFVSPTGDYDYGEFQP